MNSWEPAYLGQHAHTILTLEFSLLSSEVVHEAGHFLQFCFCLIQMVFISATKLLCIGLMGIMRKDQESCSLQANIWKL